MRKGKRGAQVLIHQHFFKNIFSAEKRDAVAAAHHRVDLLHTERPPAAPGRVRSERKHSRDPFVKRVLRSAAKSRSTMRLPKRSSTRCATPEHTSRTRA